MREGPSLAGYPAGSGSGRALFAATPNGLGADENGLKFSAKVKLQSCYGKAAGSRSRFKRRAYIQKTTGDAEQIANHLYIQGAGVSQLSTFLTTPARDLSRRTFSRITGRECIFQFLQVASQLDICNDQPTDNLQRLHLCWRERVRLAINYA